jgi:hypothetical protein
MSEKFRRDVQRKPQLLTVPRIYYQSYMIPEQKGTFWEQLVQTSQTSGASMSTRPLQDLRNQKLVNCIGVLKNEPLPCTECVLTLSVEKIKHAHIATVTQTKSVTY